MTLYMSICCPPHCNNIAAEETSNAEASDLIFDRGLTIGGLLRDMMLELLLLGDTL